MTALEADIRRRIAADGPISLARLMAIANSHYYATRDPLGVAGDFITAPEISQIFGELIGLWAAAMWRAMGAPGRVSLVELGPGRGTLMADALRAIRVAPDFREALAVHLVETSPALRTIQARTLAPAGFAPQWHADLATLPDGPAIVVANEFFDALPVHQFVASPAGWRERVVGLAAHDALEFGLSPPLPAAAGQPPRAPSDAIFEVAVDAQDIMRTLARRLAGHGGAALVIDYGHIASAPGDTLQGMRNHRFVHPLADLGEADLTAHVDFAALARAATEGGAAVHGPVTQRDFLLALGLELRAARLVRSPGGADPAAVEAAAARLVDPAPTGMGALFKVLAVTDPKLPAPEGFVRLATPAEASV